MISIITILAGQVCVSHIIGPILNIENKKLTTPIEIDLNKPFILNIKITDNDDNIIDSAKVEAIVTRFATSKFDKNLGELSQINKIFTSDEIMLEKGDWKVMIKITIDNKNAFFEQYIKVKD